MARRRFEIPGTGRKTRRPSPLVLIPGRTGLWAFNPRSDLLVYGTPDLLWVDGDANTPTVGPALAVTGVPVPGQVAAGYSATYEQYGGAAYRMQAVGNLDPAAGSDVVEVGMIRTPAALAGTYVSGGTRSVLNGYMLYTVAAGGTLYATITAGGASINLSVAVAVSTTYAYAIIIDRTGLSHLVVSGLATQTAGTPAGTLASGLPYTLGARANGANPLVGGIHWKCRWKGAGVAAPWIAGGYAQCTSLFAKALT